MERRLGRGLSSLLASGEGAGGAHAEEVDIAAIRPNPRQPRKTFDGEELQELKASLQSHGLVQPIAVRAVEGGFELIAGERRWRAARLAGWTKIAARVLDSTDEQLLELALIENVQRSDLNPIEKAEGFRALQGELGLTQDEVAAKVGLRRATVTNHLRLLELPLEVQEAVSRGVIRMGHARALLALRDRQDLNSIVARIGRDDLSVRDVEKMVREDQQKEKPAPATATTQDEARRPWTADLERRLREALGTKVQLQVDASGRGQIVLEVYGRDELERLLKRLAPQDVLQ